jgi:hypothetical protein
VAVHEETTWFSPTSAPWRARCATSVLRPTRYSCVEAKKTPAISAPMVMIAASAIGSATPSRGVARKLLELDMAESPDIVNPA